MQTLRFMVALWAAVLLCGRPMLATVMSVGAESSYFSEMADSGLSNSSQFFVNHWRIWLQFHRAIEKTPTLRQQILASPKSPQGGREGGLQLMHKRLAWKFVRSQPTHIYTLQLGVYRTDRALATFMKKQRPRIEEKSIYYSIKKDFTVRYNTEAPSQFKPLFVIKDTVNNKPVKRVQYGLYASVEDAKRDASQLKNLGYSTVLKKRNLTAQFVNAVVSYSFAASLKD